MMVVCGWIKSEDANKKISEVYGLVILWTLIYMHYISYIVHLYCKYRNFPERLLDILRHIEFVTQVKKAFLFKYTFTGTLK